MKNFLLLLLAAILTLPSYGQLNCNTVNTALSLSATGGLVTLTNNSVPTATSTLYTYYTIKWGDNTTSNTSTNAAQVHTYHTSGTYTVTLYAQVLDSAFNIWCNDTATANITVTTSLNCNNVNAAMFVNVSGGNTAILYNQSTPNAAPRLSAQYLINWGDGSTPTNTSSKSNQSHLYSTTGTYLVKLYVTVQDSNNSITCVDSTSDTVTITGSSTLNCNNVNASFSKTINGNWLTLVNTSMPNPGSGINASYKIFWGDGTNTTKTNKSNTTHSYAYGTYVIKLVATYTQGSFTCKDSTIDSVTFIPPNVINGMVILDSTQIGQTDSVKIWLIKFDSTTNILSAVDSQIKPGYYPFYNFDNKPSGQYRTKAKLLNGQTSGTGYIPTYHDSSLIWSSATVINHTGANSINKNIYMRLGTVTSGPGFVGGNVSAGANKGTASGIEGINILLMDGSGNIITYAVTDVNGDYSFPNLPNATYTIHPEDMNYATTAVAITVSNGKASFTEIDFERFTKDMTIKPRAISVGISNVNDNSAQFVIFPNPAKNMVTINWNTMTNETAAINITDLSGKVVLTTEVSMNQNSKVDVSNLNTGFYFMTVATENGSRTQKLIIQ